VESRSTNVYQYSPLVYDESVHLVSGIPSDAIAIDLENYAMECHAKLGLSLNMKRANLPRKDGDEEYSPTRPGGIYLALAHRRIKGITHASELAPSYYMRVTNGGLIERGEDKYSLGTHAYLNGTDKFSQGTDKRSLGTDKVSLGTDAYSNGTDKFSQGKAVRKGGPKNQLQTPMNGKIQALIKSKIPGEVLAKAFKNKSRSRLQSEINTYGAQEGVHAGKALGEGTYKKMRLAWNDMTDE
jgi:hypothetical protein